MATSFVARDGDKYLHFTKPLFFVPAFYSRWEYLNADDNLSTSGKNLVNFCPVTHKILMRICMVGWVYTWPKYARFPCFHQSSWIGVRLAKLSGKYNG